MISGYILALGHPAAGVVSVVTLAASHSLLLALLGAFVCVLLTYGGVLAARHRRTAA
jgi:hypothetical protein